MTHTGYFQFNENNIYVFLQVRSEESLLDAGPENASKFARLVCFSTLTFGGWYFTIQHS